MRGFEALRELYEGLLDRLTGGAFSAGEDSVVTGLGRPGLATIIARLTSPRTSFLFVLGRFGSSFHQSG